MLPCSTPFISAEGEVVVERLSFWTCPPAGLCKGFTALGLGGNRKEYPKMIPKDSTKNSI